MSDQKLGRTIGVPTANLPQPVRSLALHGGYAAVCELPDGGRRTGVANIGWRPTLGSNRPVLEVHLFDFDGDLYGQRLTVFPCAKLRGEVKFEHFDALKQQIGADQRRARAYFLQRPEAGAGPRPGLNNDDSLPLASAPLAREAVTSDSSAGTPADHDDG